jgi:NlpC/P60 family putative phage cell wall peptidase
MVTRAQVVEQARTWIGTRWHHQGRVKGHGCDCAGLVIGIARELWLAEVDYANYSRYPDGTLLALCDLHMTRIDAGQSQPGDVLVFAWGAEPQHLGIVASFEGRTTIIHAYAEARRVVENDLDEAWRLRIRGAYRLPGVE